MFNFPDAMGLTEILSLAVASILVNNYILVQFLGCCSFFGAGQCGVLGGMVLHP